MKPKQLFRVIDPGYGKRNIFRFIARITMSLGPVAVATAAHRFIPWLAAEVISENNCRKNRGAPLDENGLIDHLSLQQPSRATVIGISASITNAVPRALAIIETYAHLPAELRPKAIIVGGWHAGDDPEPFLRAGATVVVHGEADLVIAPLVAALCHGQDLAEIPGISYWLGETIVRNGIPNDFDRNCAPGQQGFLVVPQEQMDSLPEPDFGLVRFATIKVLPVSRTRGCSGRCKFCRVKGVARHQSPEKLVAQIQSGFSRGIRRFFVVDDRAEEDFDGFSRWLTLLDEWVEARHIKGLDISTQHRLSLAGHPRADEVLSLMRRVGVSTVCIGFESPIKEELEAMAKPTKQSMMLEWTKAWKRYGFLVHCMMIFGYPIRPGQPQPRNSRGEVLTTAERAEIFWQFIKRVNPAYLQLLIYSPIIGTDDYQWLEAEKRVLHDIPYEFHDGLHVCYVPDPGTTPDEVQHEAVTLSRKFYARRVWRFQWLALAAHCLKVGTVVCSMPLIWAALMPLKGWQARLAWQWPKEKFRVSITHWGAQLIIVRFLASLPPFARLLSSVTKRPTT